MRPKVLIEVYGGVVQRVATNRRIEVYLVDRDNLKAGASLEEAERPFAISLARSIERELKAALHSYKVTAKGGY